MIYVKRGLDKDLAMKVAEQLRPRDRLGAHLRDELGIDQASLARPMQGGVDIGRELCVLRRGADCGASRRAGGLAHPRDRRDVSRELSPRLGAFGGHLGGAPLGRAALRVTIGGALAMAVTAAIGRIVGVAVG